MSHHHDAVNLAQEVAHHDAQNLFRTFPGAIKTIIKKQLWAERMDKNGNPFPSFQSFVEHRLWQGLELTMPQLVRYCQEDDEAVRLIRAETAGADPVQAEVERLIHCHLPGYRLVADGGAR